MESNKPSKSEQSRINGAKSHGPVTDAGKAQSARNAIKHGDFAQALKFLVPPHSSLLIHEERREFYKLFDANTEKWKPRDETELGIVREITDLEWSSMRARIVIHAMLNREVLRAAGEIVPLAPETRSVESTVAAYEALNSSRTVANLHREYASNTRLIATLQRRLAHLQRHWPGPEGNRITPIEEREFFDIPAPGERTQPPPSQVAENKDSGPKRKTKIINVRGPLTPEKVRLYQAVFPNRDLEFNIYEPIPSDDEESGSQTPPATPENAENRPPADPPVAA